ncbi:MAG: hypothetical protein HY328_08035 [Chloroflexi bacterium]|nr:hypothetical protein [Chloroflexota bacterium]
MSAVPNIAERTPQPSELVDALNTLGVLFLCGGAGAPRTIEPDALLAALATTPEARLRLALIPLLLAHPEFAEDVHDALLVLPSDVAVTLRCYYTAAYWLQLKYHTCLAAMRGQKPQLPDLFGEELHLPKQMTPDAALHALALRQQELTGRILNWRGTYEHAIQNWLCFVEHDNRWRNRAETQSARSYAPTSSAPII